MRKRYAGRGEGVEAERPKKAIRSVIRFGEQLIETNDLDPVYNAIHGARLPQDQLKRLLLAYWCFYHLGASAWLSEHEDQDFWDFMEVAALNDPAVPPSTDDLPGERWPRGAERRHFRGEACLKSIRFLSKCDPEEWVDSLYFPVRRLNTMSLDVVTDRIQKWPLFGDWIAFKSADMLERLLHVPIEFPDDLAVLYKEPRAALDMLTLEPRMANAKLLVHFSDFLAPPGLDRACGVQEVETICCKWKSAQGGHYYVGKDIKEIRHGLKGWGRTADRLLEACPPEV